MSTTFNINRLGLTLKRYFIENKQRELTFWGIAMVFFTLINMTQSGGNLISVVMFLNIAGFIFAAKAFKVFNYTPSGMHYLLIPATHLEKMITAVLLSTFYFFAMILVTYTIGTTVGISVSNLIFDTNNPIQYPLLQSVPDYYVQGQLIRSGSSILDTFIVFAGIQSIFMLGSIFFKGNAIGKTMLSIIAIGMLLGLFELFLLKITFGAYQSFGGMLLISGPMSALLFPGVETIVSIFKYALIPFFWVVTYFRLTEKEV